MNKLITATKIGDFKEINITAELPSKCPHCHTVYGESPVVSFYYGDRTKSLGFLYIQFSFVHIAKNVSLQKAILMMTLLFHFHI